jgi:hypothetical protein
LMVCIAIQYWKASTVRLVGAGSVSRFSDR